MVKQSRLGWVAAIDRFPALLLTTGNAASLHSVAMAQGLDHLQPQLCARLPARRQQGSDPNGSCEVPCSRGLPMTITQQAAQAFAALNRPGAGTAARALLWCFSFGRVARRWPTPRQSDHIPSPDSCSPDGRSIAQPLA